MKGFLAWVKRDGLLSVIKQTGVYTISSYQGWRYFVGRWESIKRTTANVKYYMGF